MVTTDELHEVYEDAIASSESLTDAQLVKLLLVANQQARALAKDVADRWHGGDQRGLPCMLAAEAGLLLAALARFAPNATGEAFALLSEHEDS